MEKGPLAASFGGALREAEGAEAGTFRTGSVASDKRAATAMVAAAAIPVPPSWSTGHSAQLGSLLAEGPLWVKPPGGSRGFGVLRVTDASGLHGQHAQTDSYGLPL